MKFYITIEGIPKLKRSFLNLKLYSIINISEILADHKYSYDTIDDYGAFIVSEKIIELIKTYVRSKRIRGIIYSNEFLNKSVIENLFDVLEPMDRIRDVVLLDDYNVPKLEEFYPYFNEIIFFPSIKKVRLIECKPISEFTEWHK